MPVWFLPWLTRPAWQLLIMQWGVLASLIFCMDRLFLAGEWQQRKEVNQQLQQRMLQIEAYQQQLNQLPTLVQLGSQLHSSATTLPSATTPSPEKESVGSRLYQRGGVMLLWRQQEKQQQQMIKFRLEYAGLLSFLDGISSEQRVRQMIIERQPEGLVTQLILQAPEGSGDE